MQLENIHGGIRCLPAARGPIPFSPHFRERLTNLTTRLSDALKRPCHPHPHPHNRPPFGPLGSGMLLAYFTCQSLLGL